MCRIVRVNMSYGVVVFCALIFSVSAATYQFPDGFKFGAATAAFQIEGAWNASDKSPNIWDVFLHNHKKITDNGDIACDSYHKWERDIEIASEIGIDFYRFSISWTRLLPSGFSNHISEDGYKYYNNLINGLLKRGIQPIVTLYHWDLPQSLQDLGGWTNPLIVDWFADYARTVFSLYADRVKTWITINEPYIYCGITYGTGALAPGIKSPGISDYLCIKYSLMAHAKAWRIYDEDFRRHFNGTIGYSNHLIWCEPENEKETEITEFQIQMMTGLFSHPVFSQEGGWPPVIEKFVAEKSEKEGYPRSRLPPFTKKEIELVKGTYDFYGLNFYTSRLVSKNLPNDTGLIQMNDTFGFIETQIVTTARPEWGKTPSFWFRIYYEGMRKQLAWLKYNYGDIPMLITENGYAGTAPDLDDKERSQYIQECLKQVLLSIYEDDVNIIGYTAWSLIDNLEWLDGYNSKFGLYEVDFSDPNRKRTQRASARFYADIIKNHSLNIN